MSFNGSGTFQINSAGQPVVSGTVISSTAFNALTADLATGLSTCITKDGQTTVTANIPMGNNKITGLAVGTAATDAANLSQVQSTAAKLINSVSGADTVTGVLSPTLGAYAAGQMFYWVAAGDNTGAVTLNIDSLGAKSVTRDGSVALAAGDIKSGEVVVVVYDGTRFQVVSQLNSAGDARFANVSIASTLYVGGVATFTSGTAAAPAITTAGDTNTGIFFPAADTIAFAEGGAETMRLDSSGNLGLGVTPSAWNSGQRALQFGSVGSLRSDTITVGINNNAFFNQSGNWIYQTTAAATRYEQASGAHSWFTAPSGTAGGTISFTQAITLDASGNLGVGITNPAQRLDVRGTTSATIRVGSTGNGGSGDEFGNLEFYWADPDAAEVKAKIYAKNVGNVGPGGGGAADLLFATTPAFGSSTERARITSAGSLLVGATSGGSYPSAMQTLSSDSGTTKWDVGPYSTAGNFIVASTAGGGVQLVGSATSWSAVSDERLKTDLSPIENAAEKVCSMRAVTGRYKTDDVNKSRAFLIAQDVQAVLPEAVNSSKISDNDDTEYLGIQYTDTIPLLVAAIKELKAELDAAKVKIAALEAK